MFCFSVSIEKICWYDNNLGILEITSSRYFLKTLLANYITFKCKSKLSQSFGFEVLIPKDLTSGVAYKFQYGFCNESYYGESIRHLDIISLDQINMSPLTGKKVETIYNTSVCDHLLQCNYFHSFDNFSVSSHENKFLVEIKGSTLIISVKPSLD